MADLNLADRLKRVEQLEDELIRKGAGIVERRGPGDTAQRRGAAGLVQASRGMGFHHQQAWPPDFPHPGSNGRFCAGE